MGMYMNDQLWSLFGKLRAIEDDDDRLQTRLIDDAGDVISTLIELDIQLMKLDRGDADGEQAGKHGKDQNDEAARSSTSRDS